MWNFNKIGRVIKEKVIHRGLVVRMTKVWFWKRKKQNGGMKYLLTMTNPQGLDTYKNSLDVPVFFDSLVASFESRRAPVEVDIDELVPEAFSAENMIEAYLEKYLKRDGYYIAMIPATRKSAEEFWASKYGGAHNALSDCYVLDVTKYDGSVSELVNESEKTFPGRYFYIEVANGFIKNTVENP